MKTKKNDFILESLANIPGTSLTLYVKGHVITGRVMKTSTYLRQLGNPDGREPAPLEALAAEFEMQEAEHEAKVEELLNRAGDATAEELKAQPETYFVHLEEARFMTGIGRWGPSPNGTLIRVRISSVDAWNHGAMETTVNSDDA